MYPGRVCSVHSPATAADRSYTSSRWMLSLRGVLRQRSLTDSAKCNILLFMSACAVRSISLTSHLHLLHFYLFIFIIYFKFFMVTFYKAMVLLCTGLMVTTHNMQYYITNTTITQLVQTTTHSITQAVTNVTQ